VAQVVYSTICSVGYTCENNMQSIGILTRNKSYIDFVVSMAQHLENSGQVQLPYTPVG